MKWLITYEKECLGNDKANELKKRVNKKTLHYYRSGVISKKNTEEKIFFIKYIDEGNDLNIIMQNIQNEIKLPEVTPKIKEIKFLNGEELPFCHETFDFSNPNPKILILGTRITKESIEAGYYYLGVENNNPFWEILSKVFEDNLFVLGNTYEERKRNIIVALNKHNIVVSDLIYSCEYAGSGDDETIIGTEKPNLADLNDVAKQADLIVLNGTYSSNQTGTLNYFNKFLGTKKIKVRESEKKNCIGEYGHLNFGDKKVRYISLGSTSGEYRMNNPIETKSIEWKSAIEEQLKRFIKKDHK